ncbi:unnamed protein product [Orchesella dallaii]|uniref:Ig-like domain-containing protein n=1 Tax=Orchesella dallaii TaxID=48710 RepID=A0ABP1PQT8_9HEXA
MLIVVLLHYYECAKSTSRKRHRSNPEFWLGRYSIVNQKLVSVATDFIHSTFEDDFISKNESDYIISEDVISVLLICEAKYPIEVKFLHPEKLTYPSVHLRTISERISEFNEDLEEPRTQDYVLYTSISFANVKFFSSTLVCQSVENSAINSSVHVYKLVFDGIERQGDTIQVKVDAKNPLQVELPCRPATPAASITLQKQFQVKVWGWGHEQLHSTVPIWSDFKWSSFDPKAGFTLTLPKTQIYFDPIPPQVSLFGLYKCSISGGDDNEFVFINVTRKSVEDKPSHELPFKTKFILRKNADAGLMVPPLTLDQNIKTNYDNALYKCCSGVPSKPPSLLALSCENALQCDMYKTMLTQIDNYEGTRTSKKRWDSILHKQFHNISSDCALSILLGGSTIVRCTGDNVDISEHYYKLITSNEKAITNNKFLSKKSFNHHAKEHDYEPLSLAWNAEVNRKIGIIIGKPIPKNWRRTSRKRNKIMHSARTAFRNRLYSLHSPESTSERRTISILEVADKKTDIYEGEEIYFVCFSLPMFHADGGYLRITWKNGTNLVLEEDYGYSTAIIESSSTSSIHFSGLDGFGLNPTIAKIIETDVEMTSVECFQPLLNASTWERIQLKIEVHASHEPVFSGASEEIMYAYLHEAGHEIVCELVQGAPAPETITVTKDQKPIQEQIIQPALNTTTPPITEITININPDVDNIVTIKLPTISYESHGVYECMAENIKGRAVKTVRLIVVGMQDIEIV